MEIIARFPSLPAEPPPPSAVPSADPPPPPPEMVTAPPRHRPVVVGASAFPTRSIAVLAVVAVTIWSLALKNDARRRHAAEQAQAKAAERFERMARDTPPLDAKEPRPR